MAWRDTLTNLRDELAEARAQRLREAQEEDAEAEKLRAGLRELAASLDIAQLLVDVNAILLQGNGALETFVSWEEGDDAAEEPGFNLVSLNDADDEADDVEEICLTLSWEEDGERAIEIELGIEEEDTAYLMVNGVPIRQEREALERAVVAAFREELEL